MAASNSDLLGFIRRIAPTWRKTQHIKFALLSTALLERWILCLSELAHTCSSPIQPLHGRLKRLGRFLDNPNLDEGALFVCWFKLAYRFGDAPPNRDCGLAILPILPDTSYLEPFAMPVATVPCGGRRLPVALTTYHHKEPWACFPPEAAWPRPNDDPFPPRLCRGQQTARCCCRSSTFPQRKLHRGASNRLRLLPALHSSARGPRGRRWVCSCQSLPAPPGRPTRL